MEFIRKKNAIGYFTFPMVDSTTPASLKTGLSPVDTAYYKDTSGAWTALAIADTASEIGSTGMYEIDLSATEMNHDQITIKFTVAGAQDQVLIISTIPQISDMMNILGTAVSTPATAGILDVNLKNIANAAVNTATAQIGANVVSMANDSLTAAALKTDAVTEIQAGLATPTNITAGTITTVTNLTNAPTNGDLTATMKASVNAEVDTAITDVKLDHLIAVAESGDVVNSSIIAKLASKSATPAFSSFNNTTDSLEAIADNESPAEVTANVTKIDGVALATHASGVMPADLLDINGGATNGYNATLKLKQLSIANDGGTALELTAAGGNGHGISAAGHGIGQGLFAIGGSTGGNGIRADGMASGSGIKAVGGDSSGIGINASGANGIYAAGSAAGMTLEGGGSGVGLVVAGGSVSGNAIDIYGHEKGISIAVDEDGIVVSAADGDGVRLEGGNDGSGLKAIGGNGGEDSHGINAVGGVNGGDGIHAEAPEGHGMSLYAMEDFEDLHLQTPSNTLLDVDVIQIDSVRNAAIKLAASADTETLCMVDTSRPFAPTTTEFETGSTVLAKDRWVIFRSGTLIGQAKPITACELISGKSHITTDAFTAAPSNGDTFVIV